MRDALEDIEERGSDAPPGKLKMLVSRILSLPGRINRTLDEVAQATADDDDNLLFGAP